MTNIEHDTGSEEKSDEEKPEAAGREIPTACQACKVENDEDAKFCKGCGGSMATSADDGEEEPAPSSRRPGAVAPPPTAARMTAPAKMPESATLASILRATGDSPLALKVAAIDLRRIMDTAAGITGQTKPAAIVDALLAVPHMLAKGDEARKALREQNAAASAKEHRRLCMRLVDLSPGIRSKVLADIDGHGNPYLDAKGNRLPRVRSDYARMSVGTLSTIVRDLEKDAPAPRNPFQPSKAAAETAAAAASGTAPTTFSDEQKKRLESHPDVTLLRSRGSGLTPAQLVAGLIATNPQSAAHYIAQNGSPS